jgi:plastocyanin domain-containing protein
LRNIKQAYNSVNSFNPWNSTDAIDLILFLARTLKCKKEKKKKRGRDRMVVEISATVDRGFEPRSVQTKDYTIGICFFSAKHAAL